MTEAGADGEQGRRSHASAWLLSKLQAASNTRKSTSGETTTHFNLHETLQSETRPMRSLHAAATACGPRRRVLGAQRRGGGHDRRVRARGPARRQRRVGRDKRRVTVYSTAVMVRHGTANENVAPGPSFNTAQSRPRWFSMMERLTYSPTPMPSLFVL